MDGCQLRLIGMKDRVAYCCGSDKINLVQHLEFVTGGVVVADASDLGVVCTLLK